MKIQKKYLSFIKITLIVLAYAYLAYKLYQFENYEVFFSSFSKLSIHHFFLLSFVFILLPINWLIESMKWRFLCSSFEKISIKTALKSVLSGLLTGFLSPNRIGEFIGRPLFLKKENRKSAVLMALVNSMSQTITILSFGLFALFLFLLKIDSSYFTFLPNVYVYLVLLFLLILLVFYFNTPFFARFLRKREFTKKFRKELSDLALVSNKKLLLAFFISALRYFVICLQYYLLLLFFQVEISLCEALIAILINYMLITITPSVGASDLVVRGSLALLSFQYFTENVVAVVVTGMFLWIINFVVPMLVGSIFFVKKESGNE